MIDYNALFQWLIIEPESSKRQPRPKEFYPEKLDLLLIFATIAVLALAASQS